MAPVVMVMPMPPVMTSHDGAGCSTYACSTSATYGTADDGPGNRAARRRILCKCVRNRHDRQKRPYHH